MSKIKSHLVKEIKESLSKRKLSKNDVGQFLRDVRSLIELENQKENYKTLYFYCNWSAHPIIDRNKELYPILDKINVGFTEIPIKGSESDRKYNNYIDVIIDALNFRELNLDIARFLKVYLRTLNILIPKLTLLICENILLKKIQYPTQLKKVDNKKDSTLKKTTLISERINNIEKYKNPRLGIEINYSIPILYSSLVLSEIKSNVVTVEIELSKPEYPELIKLQGSIVIN